MGLLKSLFGLATKKLSSEMMYEITLILYSRDGKRSAEIRKFSNGETYLLEGEWTEGTTFKNRHEGKLVGPFASTLHAEKFIIATSWFKGTNQ